MPTVFWNWDVFRMLTCMVHQKLITEVVFWFEIVGFLFLFVYNILKNYFQDKLNHILISPIHTVTLALLFTLPFQQYYASKGCDVYHSWTYFLGLTWASLTYLHIFGLATEPGVLSLAIFLFSSLVKAVSLEINVNNWRTLNHPIFCLYVPVSLIFAVLGCHMAAVGTIPGGLRVLRDLLGRAVRQHPHLPFWHLPVQLSSPTGETKHGKWCCSNSYFSFFFFYNFVDIELKYN